MTNINQLMSFARRTRPEQIHIVSDEDYPDDTGVRAYNMPGFKFWLVRESYWNKHVLPLMFHVFQPDNAPCDKFLGIPVFDRRTKPVCQSLDEQPDPPPPAPQMPPHELIKAILLEEHKVGIMRAERLVKAFPDQMVQAIMHHELRAGAMALLMKESEEDGHVA